MPRPSSVSHPALGLATLLSPSNAPPSACSIFGLLHDAHVEVNQPAVVVRVVGAADAGLPLCDPAGDDLSAGLWDDVAADGVNGERRSVGVVQQVGEHGRHTAFYNAYCLASRGAA